MTSPGGQAKRTGLPIVLKLDKAEELTCLSINIGVIYTGKFRTVAAAKRDVTHT
jgi:hypothetical protein